jgi:carbon-monoxide dehydrogenase medium subunit
MSMPEYYAPSTVAEAVALLQVWRDEATILAGGQDVMPAMNQGRLWPRRIVDVKHLDELRGIAVDEHVTIGARMTHREIERSPVIRTASPLLAAAARQIGGGIQVRNRGTIGGALCAANPAYDFAPCLLALEATCALAGPEGVRSVAVAKFFPAAGVTARRPDELLVSVRMPPCLPGAGWAYEKLKFTDGGYGIAGAAVTVTLTVDRTCAAVRVAVGGAEPVPRRLTDVETAVTGRRLDGTVLADAGAMAEAAIVDPIDDVLADGAYRRAMVGVLVRRALAAAAGRARG